ncbi:MAG TPA: VWA domain-containing protein [Bryobacteraceae bacterium]|nr:VWA domain-containing protein [Bryobacteraceae bacterium]
MSIPANGSGYTGVGKLGPKGSQACTAILDMVPAKLPLLLAFLPLLSYSQDFTTDVKVVNLFATVRDDQGRIVHNLSKTDFTLDEDGRAQTIRYFSQESGLPLTLGLLVDTSISQRRLLGEERAASVRFLNQVLRSDQDRAFIMHFDRDVELLQDLTSSREKLGDALAQLAVPKRDPRGREEGGTALYDSVLLAAQEVIGKGTRSGQKALILLTDGVDNGSKVDLSQAIESAQRADTLVYSILFADRGAYEGVYASMAGKKALQRISVETGGSFFEVSSSKPISAIYMRLEDELRDQYSIGYTSDRSGTAAGYRKIHLTTQRPGLSVQTRDGYYASR